MRCLNKMMIIVAVVIGFTYTANAQVAINTDGSLPNSSAMLDINSTEGGVLVPRMTAAQRDAISSPANGLLVFVSNDNQFYYYDGSAWASFGKNDGDWTLDGNDMYSTVSGNVGIGTTIPDAKLNIQGGTDVAVSGGGYIISGDLSGRNIGIDNNEIMARDNGGVSNLYLQNEGGNTVLNLNDGSVGVGTYTPNLSAKLEITSSNQGFLPPRVATVSAVSNPVAGLMVYDNFNSCMRFYNGSQWSNCMDNTATCPQQVADVENNTYNVAKIGNQCWMTENLNVGIEINGSNNQADNGTIEKYCSYDNTNNCNTYGGLYQWNEMMQYVTTVGAQGICPTGWHIPTDEEYKTLEMHFGMSYSEANNTNWRGTDQGSQLAGNASLWANGDLKQNANFGTSGFDIFPGGSRYTTGTFHNLTGYTRFWSSSQNGSSPWIRNLGYNTTQVSRAYGYSKDYGFSVRCIKD